jgi:hypothetical protein
VESGVYVDFFFLFSYIMPSHVRSATIQAALLNVTSVIIAQLLTRYRGPGVAVRSSSLNPLGLEFLPIVHFFVLSLLFTPPNVIWQQFLERKFPGYPPTEEKQKLKIDEDGSVSNLSTFKFAP